MKNNYDRLVREIGKTWRVITQIINLFRIVTLIICLCGIPAFLYVTTCIAIGQYRVIFPAVLQIQLLILAWIILIFFIIGGFYFSEHNVQTLPLVIRFFRRVLWLFAWYNVFVFSCLLIYIAISMALLYLDIKYENVCDIRLLLNADNQLKFIRHFKKAWGPCVPAINGDRWCGWMLFESWAMDSQTMGGITRQELQDRMNDALAWVNYLDRYETLIEMREGKIGRIGFVSTLPATIENWGAKNLFSSPIFWSWFGNIYDIKPEVYENLWHNRIDAKFEQPFIDAQLNAKEECQGFLNRINKQGTLWRDYLNTLKLYTGRDEIIELRRYYGAPIDGLKNWRPLRPTRNLFNMGFYPFYYEPYNPRSYVEPKIWSAFHLLGKYDLNPKRFPVEAKRVVPMDPHFFTKGPFCIWVTKLGEEWILQVPFQWLTRHQYPVSEIHKAKLWPINCAWYAIAHGWITPEIAVQDGFFRMRDVITSVNSWFHMKRPYDPGFSDYRRLIYGYDRNPNRPYLPLRPMSVKFYLDCGFFKPDDIDIRYFIRHKIYTPEEALEMGFTKQAVYPHYDADNLLIGAIDVEYAIEVNLLSIESALDEGLITKQHAINCGFLKE